MALTLLLPTPSFVNAFSCKDQSTAQGVALVSFCQAVTSETLLAARCHTHMGTNTTIQPSSFFPSHFSLTLFLSFYVLFQIWVIHLLLILPRIFTTKALKVLFSHALFLSFSCLTSSTALCQLMTAWRLSRLTATSARSWSTNATSEWHDEFLPCCREIPTRLTFLLLVQVRLLGTHGTHTMTFDLLVTRFFSILHVESNSREYAFACNWKMD